MELGNRNQNYLISKTVIYNDTKSTHNFACVRHFSKGFLSSSLTDSPNVSLYKNIQIEIHHN